MIECRLRKGNGDNFNAIVIVDKHGWLRSQIAKTCAALPYQPFLHNQNGNQENDYITLLFFGWNNGCQAGVEVESELKSESIFSDRSRSWRQSRLELVDSATLVLTGPKQI